MISAVISTVIGCAVANFLWAAFVNSDFTRAFDLTFFQAMAISIFAWNLHRTSGKES